MSTSQTNQQNRDGLLLAGTQKHFLNVPTLAFGGKTYTPQDVITALQSRIGTGTALKDARTAYHAAVQADRQERSQTRKFINAFVTFVQATFGDDLAALADFGLSPKKAPKTKPAVKVVAAEKAKATRQARHTLGKKQKQKVKGDPPPPAANASTPNAPTPRPTQ